MLRHVNKVRRRYHQYVDQMRVGLALARTQPTPSVPYGGEPRIGVVFVNYNTHRFTKLMLLTLCENIQELRPHRFVAVDNGSTDGSCEFLRALHDAIPSFKLVRNLNRPTHAGGLRAGLDHIAASEASLAPKLQTNLYLIIDSDIIVLRPDWLTDMCLDLHRHEASLVGEIQFDVGEPYAHPSCILVRRDSYESPGVWPFVDHGAPALWLQRSMRRRGMNVIDFPVRLNNYIVHRGQGTVANIAPFCRRHPYATVKARAHFHGNHDGERLWRQCEEKWPTALPSSGDAEAVRIISEHIS